MSNCNCLACRIKRNAERTETVGLTEQEIVGMSLTQAQANVNNANAVAVLTESMRELHQLGESSRAAAVGRLLDELLPKTETVRPSNSTYGEAGTESPKSGFERMSFDEFTASFEADKQQTIATMAKELADMLGVPVDVFSFSKR